ncbi:CsbD family protein [Sphingomonas sp.]|uniref:CsbD family protein n=1 Tax=Sphingomonas sp. TaxID=28214 RepID=UPI003B3AE814
MGELTDKIKGVSNEIAGKVKQAVGDATDRPDVQAEGSAQELKGEGQNLKGSVKGALGDKI